VHFPVAVEEGDLKENSNMRKTSIPRVDWEIAKEIVSYRKLIRWAIKSFEPYKSAGPDGTLSHFGRIHFYIRDCIL